MAAALSDDAITTSNHPENRFDQVMQDVKAVKLEYIRNRQAAVSKLNDLSNQVAQMGDDIQRTTTNVAAISKDLQEISKLVKDINEVQLRNQQLAHASDGLDLFHDEKGHCFEQNKNNISKEQNGQVVTCDPSGLGVHIDTANGSAGPYGDPGGVTADLSAVNDNSARITGGRADPYYENASVYDCPAIVSDAYARATRNPRCPYIGCVGVSGASTRISGECQYPCGGRATVLGDPARVAGSCRYPCGSRAGAFAAPARVADDCLYPCGDRAGVLGDPARVTGNCRYPCGSRAGAFAAPARVADGCRYPCGDRAGVLGDPARVTDDCRYLRGSRADVFSAPARATDDCRCLCGSRAEVFAAHARVPADCRDPCRGHATNCGNPGARRPCAATIFGLPRNSCAPFNRPATVFGYPRNPCASFCGPINFFDFIRDPCAAYPGPAGAYLDLTRTIAGLADPYSLGRIKGNSCSVGKACSTRDSGCPAAESRCSPGDPKCSQCSRTGHLRGRFKPRRKSFQIYRARSTYRRRSNPYKVPRDRGSILDSIPDSIEAVGSVEVLTEVPPDLESKGPANAVEPEPIAVRPATVDERPTTVFNSFEDAGPANENLPTDWCPEDSCASYDSCAADFDPADTCAPYSCYDKFGGPRANAFLGNTKLDLCELEKEMHDIFNVFIQECCHCTCSFPKNKFYSLCHKIQHHGIESMLFRDLIYMHREIFMAAEKLHPGYLLDDEMVPSEDGIKRSDMLTCYKRQGELCSSDSEEMLEEKVWELDKDIEMLKEYLDTYNTWTF